MANPGELKPLESHSLTITQIGMPFKAFALIEDYNIYKLVQVSKMFFYDFQALIFFDTFNFSRGIKPVVLNDIF